MGIIFYSGSLLSRRLPSGQMYSLLLELLLRTVLGCYFGG